MQFRKKTLLEQCNKKTVDRPEQKQMMLTIYKENEVLQDFVMDKSKFLYYFHHAFVSLIYSYPNIFKN